MSGNKRGSSFDILFDQDQEYSNTKKMKFDSTKKSDLIKAEQIESTNMQHIQPNSGVTILEPMTSSEQILMKEKTWTYGNCFYDRILQLDLKCKIRLLQI